jgi:hypothetical protein
MQCVLICRMQRMHPLYESPLLIRSEASHCNSTGDFDTDEEEQEEDPELVEGSELGPEDLDEEDEEDEEEGAHDDARPPPAKRPGLYVSFNTKEELCSCHICLPQYTSRRLTSCIDTQVILIKNITSERQDHATKVQEEGKSQKGRAERR